MATTDSANPNVPPTQTSSGAPYPEEAARRLQDAPPGTAPAEDGGVKAAAEEIAAKGIVPAEDGGVDAPSEMLADDPELESSVLGQTTGSDEPATESGIDPSAGDNADATTAGGPDLPDDPGAEPDVKDAAANASS